jgi:hypothetical protein
MFLGVQAGCSTATPRGQVPAAPAAPAADVAGRWEGEWSGQLRSGRLILTLRREGDRLVGTQEFANLPTGWITIGPDMQNVAWDGRTLAWTLAGVDKAQLVMSPDGRQLNGVAPTRTGVLRLVVSRM